MMSSVIAPALTGKISDTTGSKVMGFYIAVVILLIGTILFMLVNLKKRRGRFCLINKKNNANLSFIE